MQERPMNQGVNQPLGADLQQGTQPIAPGDAEKADAATESATRFPQLAASGPTCSKCGETSTVGAFRCQCGAWLAGNPGALKTGRYSRQLQDDARPWVTGVIAQVIADKGGPGALSELQSQVLEQGLAPTLVILRFLGANLMAEGPLTGKGRQRAATTAYLQTLDRFMRLCQTVGLERASKHLPNPADWLEGKA